METDTMNWQPEYEHHCASCGIDINDGVDVVDTERMTAHLVCSLECASVYPELQPIIPPSMTPIEPDVPDWAYTSPSQPEPVAMVDEAKVIQILAPWDSVTDLLMYEFNDGDEGVDA